MDSNSSSSVSGHKDVETDFLASELERLAEHVNWNRWDIEEFEGRLLDVVERVDGTRAEFAELEEDVGVLRGEVDGVRRAVDRQEDVLERQVDVIESLESELAALRSEMCEVRRVLDRGFWDGICSFAVGLRKSVERRV